MAKAGRPKAIRLVEPVMTYLTPRMRRGVEAAALHDQVPVSVWIRQLLAAEVSRREVREQLEQKTP